MVFFRKTEEERPKASAGPGQPARRGAPGQPDRPRGCGGRKELERLDKTDASVAEYTIGINYLDYLISLPWNRFTEDNLDLKKGGTHPGVPVLRPEVKERILEYLAVRTLCSLSRPPRSWWWTTKKSPAPTWNISSEEEGHQVTTAANGLEALEKVKAHEFDVILTDLKMEKMDGLQLLEAAKQISPHTEIIMITGYATVSSAVDALKKGAAHYLSKPIKLDELRDTVREIVAKKRHLQMNRGPTLCFAGPPGTGKTSMGQAIAEALERKFVRLSLAGLRDEAELRGQRRTYVGAMPGRIINELRRLEVKNPVFMLDEIDKIGQDFRGDPASVLLEILDPQQNSHFVDHYLDLPFDLSEVMFITTANVVENLPAPLLDRLEVIYFPGYTEKEKVQIAHHFLLPRQLREHALNHLGIDFTDTALAKIIRCYTREAGLRNLEREIAMVCRKLARIALQGKGASSALTVDGEMVEKFLGPRKYMHEVAEAGNQVGVTTGLVWTEFGGEIIFVEASDMKGHKQLILTGSLGTVLQESAQTALSYIRSHAAQFGLNPDFFADRDIHIHLPSGAIPKEGPSAGVTIALALLSLLTGRAARRDVAVTGELTLSGRILPVSGIREKILAAQRGGVKVVVFPRQNEADIENLEGEVKAGLDIVLADKIEPLTDLVLLPAVP